jgi:hypothetical protein
MGDTVLVGAKVPDAIKLIRRLDASGDSPTLAVWYFYDEEDEWRLLLAGPTFDALLPEHELDAYRKLVDAMAKMPFSSLNLSDLKLLQTQSPLAQSLRRLVHSGPKAILHARYSNTTLNGIFIKEMIILRAV